MQLKASKSNSKILGDLVDKSTDTHSPWIEARYVRPLSISPVTGNLCQIEPKTSEAAELISYCRREAQDTGNRGSYTQSCKVLRPPLCDEKVTLEPR